MKSWEIETLTPDSLREYRNRNKEKDYLLVDVRQPWEYENGHIPGATLIPAGEMESRLYELPADRDLIFYCHVGGRSQAAAALAAEGEVSRKKIYNLMGGIMGWNEKVITDYPKVEIFDKTQGLSDLLITVINLEKGALRFYETVQKAAPAQIADVFMDLAKAERAHARTVYGYWEKTQTDMSPPPFDELFESVKGEVLEGGMPLSDAMSQLHSLKGSFCLNLLEMALDIEYSAFDLYRTAAESADDPGAREAFFTIAQAEKAHMRILMAEIPKCG